MAKTIRETMEVILLSLFVFTGLQVSIQNFRVEGSSMRPTMATGHYLLVNKLAYFSFDSALMEPIIIADQKQESTKIYPFDSPKRGDVIVFHPPLETDRDFVKRIIGLPGETIAIRKGITYINEAPVDEPYMRETLTQSLQSLTIPDFTYFVMGDNRNHSNDSRNWGPVHEDDIVGKVWVTYWPLNRASILE